MARRNPLTLSNKVIRDAEKHLARSDKIMSRLVSTHGACPLASREFQPFQTLATAIISQQLSSKAAESIKRRVLGVVPTFSADGFSRVALDTLRTAGLSAAKASYLIELAIRIRDGRLNLDTLVQQSDQKVIDALTELPGIGRWTAEMFLIFGLKRPDVLALSDTGLQRSARLLYGDGTELKSIAPSWRPYCSVASWYLWRHLDPR